MGGAEAAGAVDDAARLQAAVRRRRRPPAPVRRGPPDGRPLAAARTSSLPTRPSCSSRAAAWPPSRRPRRGRWPAPPTRPTLASGRPDHTLAPDERRQIFGFLVGAGAAEHWEGFLTEELALEGTDPRDPTWQHGRRRAARSGAPSIGAGASGLAAAHRLRQAGIEVTVFEKNGDVGGTWLENVYPGCRVDVPNQLYSFSFAQTNDWVSRFSAQPDLLAYLQATAKDLDLGDVHPLPQRGDRGPLRRRRAAVVA